MTSDDKCCPPPKEVQDFLFKQASISQVCDEFVGTSANPSLIAVDGKRGILYVGHDKKLIVFKPGSDTTPEWKLELDLPDGVCRLALSCDHSFLAVAFNNPSALIYDASSIHKHKLEVLHEIRLSSSGGVVLVTDLKWNPAIPEILCSITSDHTIGCFQVNRDRRTGVQIIGMEKPQGIEALCVSWSPKGKQLVVGCKNGDIIQLKPELKPARHLTGPNPYEGVIISILWVSNYQFCACYFHPNEQRISMMLVDAPKGVTAPKYVNYEDVTFGTGSMEGLTYYLEHISEWGIIIAASTHSCEVAVLGTDDNGATWSQYQLMDDSTAQLPLNRKTKTENYPVGIAIDKSSTQKLPWGAENFLPNSVPVLRILVTSGQLCCFHMVNLKANAPAICTPPTEFIIAPQLPRPSLGPSEISFNLHAGITSTPRSKQVPTENNKPKPSVNMFGDSSNPNFTLPPSYNKASNIVSQPEVKTNVLFGEGDGKISFLPQQNKQVTQPVIASQTTQQIKQTTPQLIPQLGVQQSNSQQLGIQQTNLQQSSIQQASVQQQSSIQLNTKPAEFSLKSDNRIELKIPSVSAQTETRLVKELAREPPPQYPQEEPNSTVKEAPAYDDGLCLRAYYEEQARFEKELKSRLDLPVWNCGTEEERQLLVKRTNEIDEFLKELRETTNSLVSEIAYLKALFLQSFAWIEESKSKNSSNADIGGRNRSDSKLADLQRFYYYTQSQLVQATKALDLEWADHNNREMSRMKIPSLEKIYQSLIRYSQIITQEKKNLEDLAKKWRSIGRENNAVSSLNQSMSSMNLSHSSTLAPNDAAIDQRCKYIAKSTKNFSKEKQMKLRDLLSESAPKIVRAVRPTAVQDRLEATLSSLAALKNTEPTNKTRQNKNTANQQKIDAIRSPLTDPAKSTGQNSLSSLDNLVSGIGANVSGVSPLGKSTSSAAPFASFGAKATEAAPFASFAAKVADAAPFASFAAKTTEAAPFTSFGAKMPEAAPFTSFATKATEAAPFPSFGAKATEATPFPSFGAKTTDAPQLKPKENAKSPLIQTNAAAATSKPFGTLDSVNFGTSNQKPVESSKVNDVLNMFTSAPQFNLAPPLATTTASPPAPKPVTFSFSSSTTPSNNFVPQSVPKLDNSGFNFSLYPAGQQNPPTQDSLDMSTLNFGNRTDTAKTTIVSSSSSPTSLSFSKTLSTQPTLSFGTTAAPQTSGTGLSMFGKSTGTAAIVSSANKPADVSLSAALTTQVTTPSVVAPTTTAPSANTTAASPSIFSASSLFGALSSAAAPASTFSFSTAATQASKTATPALMSPTIAFDSLSNTSSTLPNLSSSLGTGVSSSTITPTFGKSAAPPVASIFSSTTPATSTTAPATSSIFGKSDGSAVVSSTSTPVTGGATSTATTTTATSSSIFANTPAATTTTSIFGGQTTVSSSSTENSFFKTSASTSVTVNAASSAATTTVTAPIFGGTTTATTTGSIFGAASSTVFGGASSATPIVAAAVTQSSNVFGTPTTTQSSSIFGTSATPSTGKSVFGTTSTASTGASVFGTNTTPNTATSVFGTSSTSSTSASVFGANTTPSTGSSIFGANSTTKSTGGSIFGGGNAGPAFGASSAFGATTTTSSSVFGGGAASTGGSVFGSASTFATNATPTASVFGGGTSAATTSASIFGSSAATTTTSSSLFGAQPAQQSSTGIFGASNLAGSTGGSVFGGAPAMGSGVSMFGGATGSPAFGQTSAFGEKPAFGSPTAGFGGFGSPPAFGNAASPGFGSSPGIGSNPALAQTSPSKVFGSNTFETLGAQAGDISFGSLAQKSPEQNKPAFGGSSSFSSWR